MKFVEGIKADVTADIVYMMCPMHLLKLDEMVKELEHGQVLEILTDYDGALNTADTTAPAAYVNCGTWIEISERAERDLLSGFPYIQINRYDESTPPDAKLCFWR